MRAHCSLCGCEKPEARPHVWRQDTCFQCGDARKDWADFDPFRVSQNWSVGRVDRRAKAIVRLGCVMVGIIVCLSGIVLFHGAWFSLMDPSDSLRVWALRLLSPALFFMGALFVFGAFRSPPLASIVSLDGVRKNRTDAL